jgi:hypothetical protein
MRQVVALPGILGIAFGSMAGLAAVMSAGPSNRDPVLWEDPLADPLFWIGAAILLLSFAAPFAVGLVDKYPLAAAVELLATGVLSGVLLGLGAFEYADDFWVVPLVSAVLFITAGGLAAAWGLRDRIRRSSTGPKRDVAGHTC